MKKIIISVLLGCLLLSSVACKSRSKEMDALEGKDPVNGALFFNTRRGSFKLGDHYFS